MPEVILEARRLHLAYGKRVAVQDLSFDLARGEILAFLGPNGAGKTSTIRMLTTIIEPSAGSFRIAGFGHEERETIRRIVGALPESLGFPPSLTGLEYLTYQARLFGLRMDDAADRARLMLDRVGLCERARSPIATYSRGMRQRLGIARALVNDPVVVFLDEPTLGLDPRGQEELMELTRRLAREHGVGVIICTHLLNEVERYCDSVIIMREGSVVAHGPVAEVVGNATQGGFRIRTAAEDGDRALDVIRSLGIAAPRLHEDGWISVRGGDIDLDGRRPSAIVLQTLLSRGVRVMSFEETSGRLHEAFLHLTEGAS